MHVECLQETTVAQVSRRVQGKCPAAMEAVEACEKAEHGKTKEQKQQEQDEVGGLALTAMAPWMSTPCVCLHQAQHPLAFPLQHYPGFTIVCSCPRNRTLVFL